MEARILKRERLSQLIDAFIEQYEVIAPTDDSSYGIIGSASEMHLTKAKPAKSPKDFLFPQREILIQYVLSGEQVALADPPVPAPVDRILFGTRPCDAAAFPVIDQVFGWDEVDAAYFQRRERTVVVSIACDEPCETCFCTSLGGSPAGIEGSDLLLTPLREGYHVQIITARGQALVEQYERLFQESDRVRNRERAALEDTWRDAIAETVDLAGIEGADFESPVWETLAQACVDCGICTFLCPTCHCFDIQDEGDPNRGERVRVWDACTFYEYTRTHAGQPRPTHHRRYRQRIMHKFRYYPENLGKVLCVGCGRCIQYCPVQIDLRAVLEAVKG
ncbi:MAG TPA: 4Fe-4S dicluster domain-containing protein [Anaerolineae bacterium]|nr:4Fe-4S dicluster domain-containing protein [Anaerolineae bacterium]